MSQQQRVAKQWLQRQFKSSGIQIEPAALGKLSEVVEQLDDPEKFLHELLDEIETNFDERKVTLSLLEDFLGEFEGRSRGGDVLEVIDAFKAPLILYDPIRKLFHHSTAPRKVFADASSKTQLFIDRFLLVQQRLQRNQLFRPVQWGQLVGKNSSRNAPQLTELKAMLGLVGQRRYVAGFLTRQDENSYFIEDLSARLPLDISEAEQAGGIFTENCIVVAEGELTPGGAFKVSAIGLPPVEKRTESLAALQGLDFFGGKGPKVTTPEEYDRWANMYDEDRIVVLSDVHLDRPEVLDNLHTVFRGYSAMDPPPSTFVLMGNFQSFDANAGAASLIRIRENFALLGRIIGQYSALRQHSRFLLVPGPGDVGPGDMLPRPPLPKALIAPLLEAVPNVQLCSNPCRIRHGPTELVLFRNNMQRKMRGLCILPPPVEPVFEDEQGHSGSSGSVLFDHLCATVLQEAHLCPVPLEYQPVLWEWDHSLWVYPLPHGLVLADAEPAATFTMDTCACMNPGSMLQGTFGAWRPTANEMELCDVSGGGDEDEEEEEEDEEEEEREEAAAAEEEDGGEERIVEVVEKEAEEEEIVLEEEAERDELSGLDEDMLDETDI